VIIDAHTHRYADEVIADPVKFALEQKESHWLKLVIPTQGKGLQGWSDRKEMLSQMKSDKVDRAILQGWYWENPRSCVLQNDWHAKWIRQDPQNFIGFVSIHPFIKDPLDELKRRQDQGFSGIGECHPWVQGATLKNEMWMQSMQFAENEGWPVTFHVTEPVGHDYTGRVATPFDDFLWLAQEIPTLKIILAHAGGLFPFYELNPKVRPDLQNVFYDLAACPLLYDPQVYRRLIDVVGYKKIIWGTDYPLRIMPNTQKKPDFGSFKNLLLNEARLTPGEASAIFGGNILSILP
jgi:predicted TIM-barrel fold metal-dependent hydrolase